MKSVEEIRKELREAEKRAEVERHEKMKEVPIIWKYTISPQDERHDRVYDDTCRLFYLSGDIVNKEEAHAAGHYTDRSHGGMTYLYNKATKKIVCSLGGGTIFIRSGFGEPKDAEIEVVEKINQFLVENPEGGDITEIVTAFREAQKY